MIEKLKYKKMSLSGKENSVLNIYIKNSRELLKLFSNNTNGDVKKCRFVVKIH